MIPVPKLLFSLCWTECTSFLIDLLRFFSIRFYYALYLKFINYCFQHLRSSRFSCNIHPINSIFLSQGFSSWIRSYVNSGTLKFHLRNCLMVIVLFLLKKCISGSIYNRYLPSLNLFRILFFDVVERPSKLLNKFLKKSRDKSLYLIIFELFFTIDWIKRIVLIF